MRHGKYFMYDKGKKGGECTEDHDHEEEDEHVHEEGQSHHEDEEVLLTWWSGSQEIYTWWNYKFEFLQIS